MTLKSDDGMHDKSNIPTATKFTDNALMNTFDWKEFACGCGAAFINIGVTYPIYKTIFRQMLHGVPVYSALEQLRHEGLTFLYRGIFPPLAQRTVSLSLMFGVFDGVRRYVVENCNTNLYTAKVIAGLTSGTVEAILLPFERVQSLLAHSKYHQHFANTPEAFRYVWVNHGFRELYRGYVPVLWRNGPSNAIFFILREEANRQLPRRATAPANALQEFFAGAFIGATISTIFYPINVVKVAMQGEMGHKYEGMMRTYKRIYHARGSKIRHIYKGCAFNTLRSFLGWGIMNTSYEYLKRLLS